MTDRAECPNCGNVCVSFVRRDDQLTAAHARIAELEERIRQLVEFRKMADPVLTKATGEKYEFSDGK